MSYLVRWCNVNYQRVYNELIEKRKNDPANQYGYSENHHIIPKCMNGTDDSDNLVSLTVREHFLAHWLLHLIYPKNFKLLSAWNAFCQSSHKRPMSRFYELCRIKWIEALKTRKEWNPEWHENWTQQATGKIWINNKIKSMRIAPDLLDEYIADGWTTGRITFKRKGHSPEHRAKISAANKGNASVFKGKKKADLPNLDLGIKIMRYTRVANGDYNPKAGDLEFIQVLKENDVVVFNEKTQRYKYNKKCDRNLVKSLIN